MVSLCCWPDETCKLSRDSSKCPSGWPQFPQLVSPRPSLPPTHLWIVVCTSNTVLPGSPASFHNPLPPSPPCPTSFTCPPNQPIPMLIALSKLTFPNGKRSSESFKGKIGIHEMYHENLGLEKKKSRPYSPCRNSEHRRPPVYCFSHRSQFQFSSHCFITRELNLHTPKQRDGSLVLFSSFLKKSLNLSCRLKQT